MGKLRKYRIECEHTDKTMKMLGKHMRISHIPPHDQGSSKYRDAYVWKKEQLVGGFNPSEKI